MITRSGREIVCRLAELDDEEWLYELQCKTETRKFANNPAPPSIDGHAMWLRQTLNDPRRTFIVSEVAGKRVGMLRLDHGDANDRVSIAVDPDQFRNGIAAASLAFAARLAPNRVLEAEVMHGNMASQALFRDAGYEQVKENLFRRRPR
jgi:ribosomal protein S18 acetylase RimI-like enzyme